MTFASKKAMIQRFSERQLVDMTDRADPPAGVIDSEILGVAMADADALVDQALATAGLKVKEAPPLVLVSIACDIARYRLSPDLPVQEDRAKHVIERRYDNAMKQLAAIASGSMNVAGTELIVSDDVSSGIAIGSKRATYGADFDSKFRTTL